MAMCIDRFLLACAPAFAGQSGVHVVVKKKKVGVVRAKKASPAYLYTQGAALHSASLRAPCFDFHCFHDRISKKKVT
jgi:hypothetical protein